MGKGSVRLGVVIALVGACCVRVQAQTQVNLDTTARRLIGGVASLDRAQYFNVHGTLNPAPAAQSELWQPQHMNMATGRVSSELDQFITQNLPEDPLRPGFVDPTALVNKLRGDYANFVQSNSRWEALRNLQHAPILVQSGRANSFWPAYLREDPVSGQVHPHMPRNAPGYADMLSTYLEHAVYGSPGNPRVLPTNIQNERFYLELVNEPNAFLDNDWTEQDFIDWHIEVSQLVKAEHPQVKIGGASFCCSDFVGNNFARWNSEFKPLIEQAGNDLDFFSLHPYDRYSVRSPTFYERDFAKGAGHTAGQMDLIEAHSFNVLGEVRPMAFTEYGSWNRTDLADGTYGSYDRPTMQWDLVRDIREKMLVFLERPDRVLNSVPFVAPRHWQGGVPTHPDGDNVLWEQDGAGVWTETIVGNFFRMLGPLQGANLGITSDNPDLQTVAYRNGNEIYVFLNNLMSANQAVDISAVTGAANVLSASLDRIHRVGMTPTFSQGVDVTSTWQSLTLSSEEAAVLTLTLDQAMLFDAAFDETTTYGDATTVPIDQPGGRSSTINVTADMTDAVSATLRIGYNRPGDLVEAFDVIVNGTRLSFSADQLAIDDGEYEYVVREIDVPLALLQDGNNTVVADFLGLGGTIGAVALEVVRSLGDYDDSGLLDLPDLDEIVWAFGAGDLAFDLNGDASIDHLDAVAWIEDLRGAFMGDLDFDGLVNIDDFQMFLQGLHGGDLSGMLPSAAYGIGDVNFDGIGDHTDFVLFKGYYDAVNGTGAFAALIPEPSHGIRMFWAWCLMGWATRRARPL